MELSSFDFEVATKPGADHGNADALSRRPVGADGALSVPDAAGTTSAEGAEPQRHTRLQDMREMFRLNASDDGAEPQGERSGEQARATIEDPRGIRPDGGGTPRPGDAVEGATRAATGAGAQERSHGAPTHMQDGNGGMTAQPDDAIEGAARVATGAVDREGRNDDTPQEQDGSTGRDIRGAQEGDHTLQQIRAWCEDKATPDFNRMGEWKKILKSRWTKVQVRQGVVGIASDESFRALVPKAIRSDILSMAHEHPTSGHMGRHRTSGRVTTRFIWPGLSTDVRVFCERCTLCQRRHRPAPAKRAPMVTEVSSRPFERIAMDITEMPTSIRGNKYALVIMDYFSKYVRIYPMKDQKTETVLEGLLDWVHDFGVPERLHSDQGPQFESRVFQEMCRRLGIRKTRTTPYHPQSDGMIERFNRTLKNMISKYVDREGLFWDDNVKACGMAYNSSVHSTTGYTPYFLVHGFEPRMPLDAAFQPPQSPVPVRSYLEDRLRAIRAAYERVVGNSERAVRSAAQKHDEKVCAHNYQMGDRVWARDFRSAVGGKPKLGLPYKGPWTIAGKVGEAAYKVLGEDGKIRVLHHNHLKPFIGESEPAGGAPGDSENTETPPDVSTSPGRGEPARQPGGANAGGRVPLIPWFVVRQPPVHVEPGEEGREDDDLPVYGPPAPPFTRAGRMSRPVTHYQAGSQS